MKPGKMDRRVTLQTRVLTRNSHGEEVETFTDLATVWAEKRDLRGREFYAARETHADVTTTFRIRYRDDLTAIHRLICDGVVYDINHVAEIGREGGIELLTTGTV